MRRPDTRTAGRVPTQPAAPTASTHNDPTKVSRQFTAPAGVDAWWWSGAVLAVEMAARTGSPFDTTLLQRFGVPAPESPSWWGVLIAACAAKKTIEATGTAGVVTRDDGRLAPVRYWRGTDEFRARVNGEVATR